MQRRDSIKLMLAGAGALFPLPNVVTDSSSLSESDATADCAGDESRKLPAFSWLKLGEVKPDGWIREQMLRDLDVGFAGKLDRLCPEASSDIFVSGRITSVSENNWWNGETEGNWRTGHLQMAYLTDHPEAMQSATKFVDRIVASQEVDGYLGVFAAHLRYSQPGELWTQTCLLRGLLDYSEVNNDRKVLDVVVRAANLVIKRYGSEGNSLPPNVGGLGQSHDLMISDVMERLYAATGDQSYRDFTVGLYAAVSRSAATSDTSLSSLLEIKRGFQDHGVNTYETIRVPLWLWKATGREDFGRASMNALAKLARYTEPSGSAVSQENILGLEPNPSTTQYEYCSTKEIQYTLQSALQKTGIASIGDSIERIWFNAAQGSRLADGSAIAYLTSDNCLHCDGRTPDSTSKAPGSKYSPTHRDVAVCCNPNAANVAALFVRGMWMRTEDGGIVATLYGPATLTTQVRGVRVQIQQRTRYPFEHIVDMIITPERSVRFPIHLRDPAWSQGTRVTCPGAVVRKVGKYLRITKTWRPGDRIRLSFEASIQEVRAVNGEIALRYGALLFAQPLESTKVSRRTYEVAGFEDSYFIPKAAYPRVALLRRLYQYPSRRHW